MNVLYFALSRSEYGIIHPYEYYVGACDSIVKPVSLWSMLKSETALKMRK
jgi:hypothetical protein